MAKFGIALEWGSRGRWFESSHSDQTMIIRTTLSKWVMCSDLSFLLNMCFDGQGRDYHPALVFLDLFFLLTLRTIKTSYLYNKFIFYNHCIKFFRGLPAAGTKATAGNGLENGMGMTVGTEYME